MKIHEYQGKQILNNFNVPIQDGYVIEDIGSAEETIRRVQQDFNTTDVVVKAQIHAGGRGKGGGVKYSPDFETALNHTKNSTNLTSVSRTSESHFITTPSLKAHPATYSQPTYAGPALDTPPPTLYGR